MLFRFLDAEGLTDKTMIVFTSDHGDYLGDHWLGEKDLFHEVSVKVPLIVVDPSPEADATRGTTCDALVEAIDLAPTFIEHFGGTVPRHIVEGRSLKPLLRGQKPLDWRPVAISEYDYSMLDSRRTLGRKPDECRLFMVFDGRFKYVHAPGFRPMLWDLQTDPNEYRDLGDDPEHEASGRGSRSTSSPGLSPTTTASPCRTPRSRPMARRGSCAAASSSATGTRRRSPKARKAYGIE